MLNIMVSTNFMSVFHSIKSTFAIESPTKTMSTCLSNIFAIFLEYAVKQTILDLFF